MNIFKAIKAKGYRLVSIFLGIPNQNNLPLATNDEDKNQHNIPSTNYEENPYPIGKLPYSTSLKDFTNFQVGKPLQYGTEGEMITDTRHLPEVVPTEVTSVLDYWSGHEIQIDLTDFGYSTW